MADVVADVFAFSAGDSGLPAATTFDQIMDFSAGVDSIDFAVDMVAFANIGPATAGNALVTAGLATFEGTDTTTALRLVAINAVLDAVVGSAVVFQGGVGDTANAYLYISDGVAGISANDVLIQLNAFTVNTLTITGGSAFIA